MKVQGMSAVEALPQDVMDALFVEKGCVIRKVLVLLAVSARDKAPSQAIERKKLAELLKSLGDDRFMGEWD